MGVVCGSHAHDATLHWIGILGGLHVPRRFVIPIFMVIFVFYSLKEFEYLNDTYMFYKMEGSNMRARCQRR